MKVDKIEIKGFRNLSDIVLNPAEGVNIVFGENAQGKTNLLEAIWLFSGMKSFRGAKDREFITFGKEFSKLKAEFEAGGRKQNAALTITNKREAMLNGLNLTSASGLIGKFSAVVFSPSFMSIIKDGPGERRKFTDSAVCQLRPSYTAYLTEYNRLIKQRNILLRDVSFNSSLLDMLDIIDEKLAVTGEKIIDERKKYLGILFPAVSEIYRGLSSGKEEISFSYIRKNPQNDNIPALRDLSMKELLSITRREDIINKTTSAGPHRDDIQILINGISARSFGSQGQQRSCAIAMKLGEAEVINNKTGEQPIVLLDDVMSELDAARQDYILNHIENRQVFITCCEVSSVLRLSGGKTFNIAKGEIV